MITLFENPWTASAAVALMLSSLIWAYLVFFRNRFWLCDQFLGLSPPISPWPSVAIVIPARNEAETIEEVARCHAHTAYRGKVLLVIVDDNSEDGTALLAANGARSGTIDYQIVQAPPLEKGWTGKLWALKAGLSHVEKELPEIDYILLTDADIVHEPETLNFLAQKAENEDRDLVSVMAQLDCSGFWGRLLIPPFIFFFQKLYPFPAVNTPQKKVGAAAGGCVLVRRKALDAIGGIERIRDALIDDCTLAQAIKDDGPHGNIWLGLSDKVVSLRDNSSFSSLWTMVTRTAFAQLEHSILFLVVSVFGMIATYLVAPVTVFAGLFFGELGLAAMALALWLTMAVTYLPTLRLYGLSPIWTMTLPLAASLYLAMTIGSAIKHWTGQGGAWKGRTYSDLKG